MSPGMLSPEEVQARLDAQAPKSFIERIQATLEEWIYELNERESFIFRIYDWVNEIWARITFRGVRRRAASVNHDIDARGNVARFRFLEPSDIDVFADLLASFDFKYVPPHPLDRRSAERALRRSSYLPFGIFYQDELIGYVLVRLFFLRRAVSGIWVLPQYHDLGLAVAGVRASGVFTRAEALPDYVTVPLDNIPSLMGAQAAGWRIIRSNQRFHVLLR